MGGYGAFNWALRQPGRFAAAASLSGVLDLPATGDRLDGEVDPHLWDRVFGRSPAQRRDTDDDVFSLLQRAAAVRTDLPALYVGCGTEDRLFAQNQQFVDRARDLDVPLTADFGPGDHEWGLWDRMIQDVLAWLPLRPAAEPGPAG